MYLVGTSYILYREGDEDIAVGENQPTNTSDILYHQGNWLRSPFPNPSNGEVSVNFYLQKSQKISLELLDSKGRMVRNILPTSQIPGGEHTVILQVQDLVTGIYTIRMRGVGLTMTKPIVVSE